jgi:hypothetical protein
LRVDPKYAPLPFAQSGAGLPVEIALPRLEPLTLDAIVPLNWGSMIKTLSAVAISAFIAAALFVLSGYAPEVEVGQSAALQKSDRRDIRVVDTGCAKQIWPNFSGSCLHGNGGKLEARLVSAGRGK